MFFNFLILQFLSLAPWTCAATEYHERLTLQPLAPSSLLGSFNFRSNASLTSFEHQDFRFFPRSLGQILQHAKTRELHLRFSTGRWDAESWGARPWNGTKEGGTGVELWAWVEADTDEEAYARWITLTNALSGLFCASLNFIDSTRTTRPVLSFEPAGDHSLSRLSGLHLLHGTLPREVVCTENLTPFLKLLPCKGKVGISSLLDGHKLFDASWQSMAIDVRPICPDSENGCLVEMEQTVDMVLDIERSKRQRGLSCSSSPGRPDLTRLGNPIPRPIPAEELVCDTSKPYASNEACYPLEFTYEQPWSLSEVFGRPIRGSCPLTEEEGAESETVCINVPHERDIYTTAGAVERKLEDGLSRCYKLPARDDFDMVLPRQTLAHPHPITQPLLYAERSFTGHGQERGGVHTLLTNPSLTSPVEFVYLESLPWFMKPYLHTLKVRTTSQNQSVPSSSFIDTNDLIKEIYYRPALDRHRGTQLELRISVPPASILTLTYDFDKAILRYTEYPPDANRGFDVAPAIIRLISSSSPSANVNYTNDINPPANVYLRTTSLLLPLPTPDFSMPYNVIILTSTVMALAFGNVFNLLVRRFVGADEMEGWDLGAVKGRIRERAGWVWRRVVGMSNGKEGREKVE